MGYNVYGEDAPNVYIKEGKIAKCLNVEGDSFGTILKHVSWSLLLNCLDHWSCISCFANSYNKVL